MLSFMAKGFFHESTVLMWPIVALFIFIAVFTAITIRTLRTDKESLSAIAGLPLAEDLPLAAHGDTGAKQ